MHVSEGTLYVQVPCSHYLIYQWSDIMTSNASSVKTAGDIVGF